MKHSDRFCPVTRQRWAQRIDPVVDRLAVAFADRPDVVVVDLLASIAAGLEYAECLVLGKVQPAERRLLPGVQNAELVVSLRGSGDPTESASLDEVIDRIRLAWHQAPSQRLGQLIVVGVQDAVRRGAIRSSAGGPRGALAALMNIEDDMWVQLFNLLDEYPGLVPGDVGGEWLAAQDVESLEADYGWTANGSGSGVRFAE